MPSRPNLTVLVFQIVRFKDKESHQIFLEPEGRTVPELYVQVRFIYPETGFLKNISFSNGHMSNRVLLA